MSSGLFGVLGPSMIGPSSSHTAGAARIGLMCKSISRGEISKVKFFLHGSFASTYKGHGTDRALVGGLLGMKPDNPQIIDSLDLAKKNNIDIEFLKENIENVHPNTVRAEIFNKNNERSTLIASSVGGGEVNVVSINGVDANISGVYNAIIIKHLDKVGMISKITSLFEKYKINIVSLRNNREEKGKNATTIIEIDSSVNKKMMDDIYLIEDVYYITNIKKI